MLSFVWPPDSPWSPRWRTKRSVAKRGLKFAKLNSKDVLYELGCGDGEVVLSSVQDFGARAIGIEIDPVRYFVTRLRIKKAGLGKFARVLRMDFKKVDLTPASVVYMYLVSAGMKRMLPKLKKELKKGTRIISYQYKIPLGKEKFLKQVDEDKQAGFYLYKVV